MISPQDRDQLAALAPQLAHLGAAMRLVAETGNDVNLPAAVFRDLSLVVESLGRIAAVMASGGPPRLVATEIAGNVVPLRRTLHADRPSDVDPT